MEIVYCDTCGLRIAANAVAGGMMSNGRVLCEKCRPAGAPAQAIPRRTSGNAHPVISEPAPQRTVKKTGTLPRTASNERSAPRTSEAQSQNGMTLGLALAGGCAALLGLFFMFSGGSSEKKTATAAASTTTAATATDSRTDRANSASSEPAAAPQKSPVVTPAIAPAPAAVPVTTAAPEPRRTESSDSKVTTSGMLGNPTAKSDPDALADAAYDKVLAAIAKEEPAGKMKGLEQFLKDVDQNTFAAARARAMLSTLKKSEESAKAPPAPAPAATTPVANATPVPGAPANPAPSNMSGAGASGAAAFKEDFETTAYGVNFGKVTNELPAGRTGKAMKMLGGDSDRRGGIYTYAYPPDTQVFKTGTLAMTADGMKLKFKYHFTNNAFEIVLGFFAPGTDDVRWAKLKPGTMTKGAWSDAEMPLSDFKVDGGGTVPSNARINRVEFWGYGEGEAYIDDVEFAP